MSTDDQEFIPLSPLIVNILEQQASQTQSVTNLVIDGLQKQLDDARATLAAVQTGVTDLLDGPYMPTPDVILRALYPRSAFVDQFRKGDPE